MGFSEPSEEMRIYAETHGLEGLDLRSSVVQQMLHLRIKHPEWERAKVMKEQHAQRWLGKPVLCIGQFIQVGRVEKIENGTLILILADQFQEAAKWIDSHYFTEHYPHKGIYSLPDLPFELTYGQAEQKRLPFYCQVVELATLPENWVVDLFTRFEERDEKERPRQTQPRMSDHIRCYLDAEKPRYEQFQAHFRQRYQERQIDICFEQELLVGSSRLLTFLVTLPGVKSGEETHYQRRIFLSYLPIEISSVIHLEHVMGDDTPIKESSLEQVRAWLRMSEWGRRFNRELSHQEGLHHGSDVPLISGNMRSE